MDDGRPPKTSRPQRRKADRDQQKAARVAGARRSRSARTSPLAPPPDGAAVLGPYETTYSVSEGYGMERDIVQPSED